MNNNKIDNSKKKKTIEKFVKEEENKIQSCKMIDEYLLKIFDIKRHSISLGYLNLN